MNRENDEVRSSAACEAQEFGSMLKPPSQATWGSDQGKSGDFDARMVPSRKR